MSLTSVSILFTIIGWFLLVLWGIASLNRSDEVAAWGMRNLKKWGIWIIVAEIVAILLFIILK